MTHGARLINDKNIIFFDGVCGLCNHFVDFLVQRVGVTDFYLSPLQGDTAKKSLPPSCYQKMSSVVVLTMEGEVLVESEAVLFIFSRLGSFWFFCSALFSFIPKFVRDFLYRFVSKNRFLLFKKKSTCRIPSREERELFLP